MRRFPVWSIWCWHQSTPKFTREALLGLLYFAGAGCPCSCILRVLVVHGPHMLVGHARHHPIYDTALLTVALRIGSVLISWDCMGAC
jgi:hypothetical protein